MIDGRMERHDVVLMTALFAVYGLCLSLIALNEVYDELCRVL